MTSEAHEHDLGLVHDLPRLLGRRRVLQLLGVGGAFALAGCGGDDGDTGATTAGAPTTAAVSSAAASATTAGGASGATAGTTSSSVAADGTTTCSQIPEETAGPFSGDGSNGPNVLAETGVVRGDIRAS